MASVGERELKQQIRSGAFSNVYFIYGEEPYLKQYYVNLLKKKTVGEQFAEFNYHEYMGAEVPMDDILKDADVLPLMGEYMFLSVCDYPFGERAADCKKLCEYLEDLPESLILVFWYNVVDVDLKKNSNFAKVEKAVSKAGTSVNLPRRSEGELVNMIVKGCKDRGAVISNYSARYLISMVGNDLKTLQNEIDELSSYALENNIEITNETIKKIASESIEARLYDLPKAILRKDIDGAFSILNMLFEVYERKPSASNDKRTPRGNPLLILSVISGNYIDMYRVKTAKAASVSLSEVSEQFGYSKNRFFVLQNADKDARKLTVRQLRDSLDVLMDAEIALKPSAANPVQRDPKTVLEETIVKLVMIIRGEKYA